MLLPWDTPGSVPPSDADAVRRTAAIFARQLKQRCAVTVVIDPDPVRGAAGVGDAAPAATVQVTLGIDASLGEEVGIPVSRPYIPLLPPSF